MILGCPKRFVLTGRHAAHAPLGDPNGQTRPLRPIGAPNLGNRCVSARLEATRRQKADRRQRLAIKFVADHCACRLNSCVGIDVCAHVSFDGQRYLNRRCARLFSPTLTAATIATPPRYRHDDEAPKVDEEDRQRPRGWVFIRPPAPRGFSSSLE
jgi:hypothetical protein